MKLENISYYTESSTTPIVTKKSILSLLLLFVVISLAAAEITFSPGIGGTVYTVHSFVEIENMEDPDASTVSEKAVTYIMPVPSTGIDVHFTHESSGFTFSIINNIGCPITIFKRGSFGNEQQYVIGSFADEQILFGYTYGVKQPLSIHCGIGAGTAIGHFSRWKRTENVSTFYYAVSPLALHIGLQYLFTQHVGITASIHDMLSFSGIFFTHKDSNPNLDKITGAFGLGNTFTLRLAVSFRL